MNSLSFSKQPRGFTIVELLIVIVVIGILATLSFVAYGSIQKSAVDTSVLSDIEGVAGEVARYSVKHNGAMGSAVEWYSPAGANGNLAVSLSTGTIVDVVASSTKYCVRGYNPGATKDSISNALLKESEPGACTALPASVAAGGTRDTTLVGWWKLNGDAIDSTGNSTTGSVSGATQTTGQGGLSNGAYHFDGVNDYIEVMPTLTSYDTFSVSAWARVQPGGAAVSGHGYVVHQAANQQEGGSIFWLAAINSGFYAGDVNGVGSVENRTTTTAIGTSTWHLITMTYDGNTRIVYGDGTAQATDTRGSMSSSSVGNRIGIGSSPFSPTYRPVLGDIDDVRIYKVALTPSQVAALYAAGAQ